MCTSDTLLEGVCCQEPHPEFDPWTERPGLDQQSSGSQQQNFQQQAVGSKPQQFGNNVSIRNYFIIVVSLQKVLYTGFMKYLP